MKKVKIIFMGFLPVILMGVYRCMVMNTVIITSDHSSQKTFIIIILVMNYWRNIRDHYLGNGNEFWPDTVVIIILVTKYLTKIYYHYLGNGISSFWWSIWPIRDHYQIFNWAKQVSFHSPKTFFLVLFVV